MSNTPFHKLSDQTEREQVQAADSHRFSLQYDQNQGPVTVKIAQYIVSGESKGKWPQVRLQLSARAGMPHLPVLF